MIKKFCRSWLLHCLLVAFTGDQTTVLLDDNQDRIGDVAVVASLPGTDPEPGTEPGLWARLVGRCLGALNLKEALGQLPRKY